jgi:hypothetical protein
MTGEADANAPAGQNSDRALMLTVRNVAALNLGYFGIEFAFAIAIGSVVLFVDSVDFLEDGAVKYSDHCRAWIFGGEARQTRYAARRRYPHSGARNALDRVAEFLDRARPGSGSPHRDGPWSACGQFYLRAALGAVPLGGRQPHACSISFGAQ